MPIDYGKLGTTDSADTVIHPREIFATLPSKAQQFQYLRDVQAEVLNGWFERRGANDVVLKMNTGSGKTAVGLLILKSCLNEGVGPAVYVTPDPYLTKQVLAEAEALGIDVATAPDSPQFLSGRAVLVVNVYKLINGKSVFGVREQGAKIRIGSLVVDDVHACLATTEGQFTLRLNAPSGTYDALFELFRDDLEQQSPTSILDLQTHDPSKNMLVPYWAWINKQGAVAEILHVANDTGDFQFVWPLVKDVLPLCQCVFGGGTVEISSRCLPIDAIPSFVDAKRRIFMSATLADDSVLVTNFDVQLDAAVAPITPSSANDVGDRLILIPQELNADLGDEELRAFVKGLSHSWNTVVIVPSKYRASLWAEHADQVLDAAALPDGVEKLKGGHVGLTVIINKYDGIDLPNDACRILVIDGLPDVRRRIDKLEEAILHGSDEQTAFALQRIEQGMGRGVRANDDYCIVMLMGRSLTSQVYASQALSRFTAATKAQFDLSLRLAQQLRGKGTSELSGVISEFLRRDPEWVRASKGALVHVKYTPTGLVSEVSRRQRQAFNAAEVRHYKGAMDAIQEAVNTAKDARVRGWLKQQLAEYTHFVDPVQSQVILQSAISENRLVTRPIEGISYRKLRPGEKAQAALCVDYIAKSYESPNALLVGAYGLLDVLKFVAGTAPAFEEGMETLARLIGFGSQRPESEYGRGPDVLWSVGHLNYLVIECKNGATTGIISKADSNQLSGSMNWFHQVYDASCSATPIVVHPVNLVEGSAAPHQGMRVITVDKLLELKTAVTGFVKAIASSGFPLRQAVVGDSLAHYKLLGDGFVERFTLRFKAKK